MSKDDCSMRRWNRGLGQYECAALNALYCSWEKECRFYTTEKVAGPDPLYVGPVTGSRTGKRIPDETIRKAVELKKRGLTWAQIGKELGHDPRALQNRIWHDQKKGKIS